MMSVADARVEALMYHFVKKLPPFGPTTSMS